MQASNTTCKLNNKGFTLSELLVTVLIMGLVTMAVGTGVTVALRNYRSISKISDADMLCQAAVTQLQNELLYSSEVDNSFGQTVFFNEMKGCRCYIVSNDANGPMGNIFLMPFAIDGGGNMAALDGYEIVPQRMLTHNMTVGLENGTINWDGNCFRGKVIVWGDTLDDGTREIVSSSEFIVNPVNK